MVNLTRFLMFPRHPKNVSTDRSWKRRQVLKFTSHFYGRARNCYSIALRRMQRALQYVTRGRELRQLGAKASWEDRITAGCQEFGWIPRGAPTMLESLARSEIYINRQTLANLAIWEPRSFKAINKIAAVKLREDKFDRKVGPMPDNVLGKL